MLIKWGNLAYAELVMYFEEEGGKQGDNVKFDWDSTVVLLLRSGLVPLSTDTWLELGSVRPLKVMATMNCKVFGLESPQL